MMNERQWQLWNKQGLFPHPTEKEEDFLQRVSLPLEKPLSHFPPSFLPKNYHLLPLEQTAAARKMVYQQWQIDPIWVPILCSNDGLRPWHGGATVIIDADSPLPFVYIQLRRRFSSASHCLKIYSREELLIHEYTHAIRYQFPPSRYDEILAYMLSSSSFRRLFGPFFSSRCFTLVWTIAIFNIVFGQILYPFFPFGAEIVILISFLLLFFSALLRFILVLCHKKTLSTCQKQLYPIFKEKSWAVIYRLTDSEISSFASMQSNAIESWIDSQQHFRWKMIALLQPKE